MPVVEVSTMYKMTSTQADCNINQRPNIKHMNTVCTTEADAAIPRSAHENMKIPIIEIMYLLPMSAVGWRCALLNTNRGCMRRKNKTPPFPECPGKRLL